MANNYTIGSVFEDNLIYADGVYANLYKIYKIPIRNQTEEEDPSKPKKDEPENPSPSEPSDPKKEPTNTPIFQENELKIIKLDDSTAEVDETSINNATPVEIYTSEDNKTVGKINIDYGKITLVYPGELKSIHDKTYPIFEYINSFDKNQVMVNDQEYNTYTLRDASRSNAEVVFE